MPLNIRCRCMPDPDGHRPALLLKGDWLVVEITDGRYTGYGESSHSRDDRACEKKIKQLFDTHVRDLDLSLASVKSLEGGPFSIAGDFVEATAISGINQALYDLLAKREGIPVWRLFSEKKQRDKVPVYATINRALTTRTLDDYREKVAGAIEQGFDSIKCAPFEAVTGDGDQVDRSRQGRSVLTSLREAFPALEIRVDFHERFRLETFKRILPDIEAVSPAWLEAPIPIGPEYAQLRPLTRRKIALGELFFGYQRFGALIENNWADVIMPDVKHVGGFGPLVDVIRNCGGRAQVSPHNPSGPVAAIASAHAAAISNSVTSMEIPLITDPRRAYYLEWMDNGLIKIPDGNGWGIEFKFI